MGKNPTKSCCRWTGAFGATVRHLLFWLSGDRAYRVYLEHWRLCHADQRGEPLSRQAFFMQRTRDRWNGINRCC